MSLNMWYAIWLISCLWSIQPLRTGVVHYNVILKVVALGNTFLKCASGVKLSLTLSSQDMGQNFLVDMLLCAVECFGNMWNALIFYF